MTNRLYSGLGTSTEFFGWQLLICPITFMMLMACGQNILKCRRRQYRRKLKQYEHEFHRTNENQRPDPESRLTSPDPKRISIPTGDRTSNTKEILNQEQDQENSRSSRQVQDEDKIRNEVKDQRSDETFVLWGSPQRREIRAFIIVWVVAQFLSYCITVIFGMILVKIFEDAGILYKPVLCHTMKDCYPGLDATSFKLETTPRKHVMVYYMKGSPTGRFSNQRMSVMYSHGDAGNIKYYRAVENYRKLVELGLDVYGWDYPGFGLSPGSPTYKDIMKAAEIVVNEVENRTNDRKLLLYGRSLGGAVTVILASKKHYPGVILQVPLDSMIKLLEDFFRFTGYAMAAVWTDKFDAFDVIHKVKSCIFHYYASDDVLMSPYREKALYKEATGKNKSCSVSILGKGKGHDSYIWNKKTNDTFLEYLTKVSEL